MARSKHRKRLTTKTCALSPEEDEARLQLDHLKIRIQDHLERFGIEGINPFSEEWIELPVGTPARTYLDEYRRTWMPPDVRLASNPEAANEMWDYLEHHEEAGTLPLCVPSLLHPVSLLDLPPDALHRLREMKLSLNDVQEVWIRVLRVYPPGSSVGEVGHVYFFVTHQEEASEPAIRH
jgi:hypothetical protein